jgi:hypothetical protein
MDQCQGKEHQEGSATDLARTLAARRRIVDGTCEVCGIPFRGTAKRRYCSHRCAVRAHRAGMTKPHNMKEREGNEQ